MQFCTLLEVVKSIVVINSAQKIFHGLSSVHKSVGLKSSIIIFYTISRFSWRFSWPRSEIEDNNFAFYEQESVEEEIADILTADKYQLVLISAVKIFLCSLLTWFIKKVLIFFLLRTTIANKMSWDTSPKRGFLTFSWLQKGKI